METNKATLGLSASQLANGTPSDRVLILKSFYKDDKCTISPAKDFNGRYLGINMNIPDIKKLEMGYVPTIESKVKLYDGIVVDLNNSTWEKDWEWMQHCVEIADDFQSGQSSPGAYFYIFRPGFESAKEVNETEQRVALMNYILQDSPENLYNRASILGVDMSGSVISDVKAFLLGLANTEPAKIKAVYESKTFSLELLFMHALKKGVISNRSGVYTFGEILLGVEDRAVVSFFANPKNAATTRAIEAITYGTKKIQANPLEHEARNGSDSEDNGAGTDDDSDGLYDDTASKTTLDVDQTQTEATSDAGVEGNTAAPAETVAPPAAPERPLSPQEKAAATRAAQAAAKAAGQK
jgi:hypothetical protein